MLTRKGQRRKATLCGHCRRPLWGRLPRWPAMSACRADTKGENRPRTAVDRVRSEHRSPRGSECRFPGHPWPEARDPGRTYGSRLNDSLAGRFDANRREPEAAGTDCRRLPEDGTFRIDVGRIRSVRLQSSLAPRLPSESCHRGKPHQQVRCKRPSAVRLSQ